MDISTENAQLWSFMVQLGIVSILLLASNVLRRKIKFVRSMFMPTAVLAGFLLLFLRSSNLLTIDVVFLEVLTYHGIALGFIAMSLRVKHKYEKRSGEGFLAIQNGAVMVTVYIVQAIIGLLISVGLSLTFMPEMFRAAGILLPMAYGQGPGTANNIGASYESLGFAGGRSYALALAAVGFLVACVVGVIYLNYLKRKSSLAQNDFMHQVKGVSTDTFQSENEIPIAESVDKFSVQMALVLSVYALTFFVLKLATNSITTYIPSIASLFNPILLGFNFIIGSGVAFLLSTLFAQLRKLKIMNHQYQNNYLLNRISGYAFDLMIIAGIGSINIGDLEGLWVPFILTAVFGGIGTFVFLRWVSKRLYMGYEEQGFISMFGLLTGTISSGILLLREIDPQYESPAANNLLTGSGTGVVLAIPVILLIGIAPQSPMMPLLVILMALPYLALLLFIILFKRKKKE